MMFSHFYSRAELISLFTVDTLRLMYYTYVDESGGLVNLTDPNTLASCLYKRVELPANTNALLQKDDLVVDAEGRRYRFVEFNRTQNDYIPVLYDIENNTHLSYDGILTRIPAIGISELLPQDIAMQLIKLGREKNYFDIDGQIRMAGDLYALDEEMAYLFLHSDSAKTKQTLIMMIDD